MTYQPMPEAVVQTLQQMHPDPFVQSAILRVYDEAPGLLTDDAVVAIQNAYATTTPAPEALPVQEN